MQRLVFLLCFFVHSLAAQHPYSDSLAMELQKAPLDTARITLLNDYAWEIMDEHPELAREKLNEALSLAQRLNFPKGEATALNELGVLEETSDNYQKALGNYKKALEIRQKLNDKKGVASLHNNIGNIYESLGEYTLALQNHIENLNIVESLNDTLRMARASYNIGVVHQEAGNYIEALNYINDYRYYVERLDDKKGMAQAYSQLGHIRYESEIFLEAKKWYTLALKNNEKIGEPSKIASSLNDLGNVLDEMDSIPEAIKCYRRAWEIRKGLNDREGIANSLNNLGGAHKHLKQYAQAIEYLKEAVSIHKSTGNKFGLMEVYNTYGDVLYDSGNIDGADKYINLYYSIAKEIDNKKYIQKAYKDIAKIYAVRGEYQKALEFRIKYDEMRYERLSESRAKDMERGEVFFSDRKRKLDLERTKIDIERKNNELQLLDAQVAAARQRQMASIAGALALGLLALLLYNRSRLRAKANKELSAKNEVIERERQRADDLLKNILPAATAEELKLHNAVKPERYDSVTVLFTDFKSFTSIAERMSPEDLVAELDECFRLFDGIMEKYGLEKIKTIGDAYMCVGGLPQRNDTHAFDAVRAALAMQHGLKAMNEVKKMGGKPFFEMRVGIHTGPVVAGVVGVKKFAYDIWGDTVNTAARMESGSEPGRVNISETTYERVKDKFQCTFRGNMPAKNKGEIAMYFVEEA